MRLFMVRRTRSFVERNYAFTECPACHTIVTAHPGSLPQLLPGTKAKDDRRFLILEGGSRFHFPKRQPKTLTFPHPRQATRTTNTPGSISDTVVDTVRLLHLPRYGLANYLKPTLDVTADIRTKQK